MTLDGDAGLDGGVVGKMATDPGGGLVPDKSTVSRPMTLVGKTKVPCLRNPMTSILS